MPVDHLLLPEADALPAIVVVRLPSGLTHFVVVWRAHGGCGAGDGSGARAALGQTRVRSCASVYVHTLALPAEAFREWAAAKTSPRRWRAACARWASATAAR